MSSFLQIIDANKQFTVLSNAAIKQSAIGIVSNHDCNKCSFHCEGYLVFEVFDCTCFFGNSRHVLKLCDFTRYKYFDNCLLNLIKELLILVRLIHVRRGKTLKLFLEYSLQGL